MKTVFLFLFLTLASFTKESVNQNPVSQLPPVTQIGANKVGCLVNGQVLLPYQKNIFGVPSVTCSYQFINDNYEFGLGFSNDKDGVKGISVLTNKLELTQGQIYTLKQEENLNSSYAYYNLGLTYFGTNVLNNGELRITKLDQTNAIISGTFWFDAINNAGVKVEVREGRFDMQYSQ